MTHWWSLARGEWILLALIAGSGLGVGVASAIGLDQLGSWLACVVGALLLGGVAWLAGRGKDSALPPVSLGAMFLAGIPLLAVWWLVATLAGMPLSGPSPLFFVWFVAGVLLTRIVARLLTAFVARKGAPA